MPRRQVTTLQELQGSPVSGCAEPRRKDRSHVYVVCIGERMVGHSPRAVFSNLKAARRFAFSEWRVVPTLVTHGAWMGTHDDSHVDEVWIHRMKVWDE